MKPCDFLGAMVECKKLPIAILSFDAEKDVPVKLVWLKGL